MEEAPVEIHNSGYLEENMKNKKEALHKCKESIHNRIELLRKTVNQDRNSFEQLQKCRFVWTFSHPTLPSNSVFTRKDQIVINCDWLYNGGNLYSRLKTYVKVLFRDGLHFIPPSPNILFTLLCTVQLGDCIIIIFILLNSKIFIFVMVSFL